MEDLEIGVMGDILTFENFVKTNNRKPRLNVI